jgi:hypothetical protein
MFFLTHKWQRRHNFKYFGIWTAYILKFFLEKSKKIHVLGIDTDPDGLDLDRHALDADSDPDPAKLCKSDPTQTNHTEKKVQHSRKRHESWTKHGSVFDCNIVKKDQIVHVLYPTKRDLFLKFQHTELLSYVFIVSVAQSSGKDWNYIAACTVQPEV